MTHKVALFFEVLAAYLDSEELKWDSWLIEVVKLFFPTLNDVFFSFHSPKEE